MILLVGAIATLLTLAPARETAPKEILMGSSINVLSVTTLDIAEATLRLLERTFSHLMPWSIFRVSSHTFLLALSTPVNFLGPCLDGKPLCPKA